MGRYIVVKKRKRSQAADRFLLLLVPALALTWYLLPRDESLEGSLQAMEAAPHLAPGEELIRSGLQGDVWVEAVRTSEPLALPDDSTYRAQVRERCAEGRLAPLLNRGGMVLEHRHGPDGELVYTLQMTYDICDQVRMG